MNIDNLTLGEIKQLTALFGGAVGILTTPTQSHPFLGKYCVIRAAQSGVHVGVLNSVSDDKVILSETRHIWSWSGALTVSDIAKNGVTEGKFSDTVAFNEISGVIEKIPTTAEAEKCLRNK